MRHAAIESWSRGSSFLHRRHPGAKLASLLILLTAISVSGQHALTICGTFLAAICTLLFVSGLPAVPLLRRSLLVIPFSLIFAAGSFISRDPATGWRLMARSYVSGCTVLLFAATTPLAAIIACLRRLRVPRLLLLILQVLYRYIFVLFYEAENMRTAALSRGGFRGVTGFHAAAGALGSLFARSHTRAGHIHQAMLSRGYGGELPVYSCYSFRVPEFGLVGAAVLLALVTTAGALH